MSFLGLAFLFALPLAAAPLLLHLFDRRRNAVIHWGAMQFLIDASAKKTSARRLKQWLLLAMRMLAIAMLVIALARPLVPAGYLGSTTRTETVFVLDNSMSMGRDSGGQSYLSNARDAISKQVSALPRHDRVRLMTTAPYPTWFTTAGVRADQASREKFSEQLKSIRPIQASSDLLASLHAASQESSEPTVANRRIVVLSDGQANDWQIADQAGWNRLRDSLIRSPLPTEIEFESLHRSSTVRLPQNLAVDRLTLRRRIVGVEQPVTFSAVIQSYAAAPAQDTALSWLVGEAQLDSEIIETVDVEQSVESIWTHTFAQPGRYRVSCQLDHDDDLLADNQASLVVEVVDEVPVVVVEESFDLAELQQDSYFVQAALGWIDGESLAGNSIYVPTVVSMLELATVDLQKQRVVVIPNLTRLEDDVVDQLSDFVREGGGLWIGLGPRTDGPAFNQNLFAEGAGLSPASLDRIADSGSDDANNNGDPNQVDRTVRIDPYRNSHPATRQLADESQLDLAETTVDRWFKFTGARFSDAGLTEKGDRDDLSTLVSLSNGSPLAVENLFGRGRVIVSAVPLKLQWSDLARKQSFVVMVRDWIDYLAQPRATKFNLKPGEPIVMPVDGFNDSNAQSGFFDLAAGPPTGFLNGPQGDSLELAAIQSDQGFEFRTSRTRVPGNYDLEVGLDEDSIPFHVERDPSESDLANLNPDTESRLRAIANPERDDSLIGDGRTGQSDPIWPFLLLGLVGLLTGELVLSGVLARERFGVAGIAEHADLDSTLPASTVNLDAMTHTYRTMPAVTKDSSGV